MTTPVALAGRGRFLARQEPSLVSQEPSLVSQEPSLVSREPSPVGWRWLLRRRAVRTQRAERAHRVGELRSNLEQRRVLSHAQLLPPGTW